VESTSPVGALGAVPRDTKRRTCNRTIGRTLMRTRQTWCSSSSSRRRHSETIVTTTETVPVRTHRSLAAHITARHSRHSATRSRRLLRHSMIRSKKTTRPSAVSLRQRDQNRQDLQAFKRSPGDRSKVQGRIRRRRRQGILEVQASVSLDSRRRRITKRNHAIERHLSGRGRKTRITVGCKDRSTR